jgi:hypothetical protein
MHSCVCVKKVVHCIVSYIYINQTTTQVSAVLRRSLLKMTESFCFALESSVPPAASGGGGGRWVYWGGRIARGSQGCSAGASMYHGSGGSSVGASMHHRRGGRGGDGAEAVRRGAGGDMGVGEDLVTGSCLTRSSGGKPGRR